MKTKTIETLLNELSNNSFKWGKEDAHDDHEPSDSYQEVKDGYHAREQELIKEILELTKND